MPDEEEDENVQAESVIAEISRTLVIIDRIERRNELKVDSNKRIKGWHAREAFLKSPKAVNRQ
jgi:hypothetical protein